MTPLAAAAAAVGKRKATRKTLELAADRSRRHRLIGLLAAAPMVAALPMAAILLALTGTPPTAAGTFGGDIPPVALAAYVTAAQRCEGLDWTLLAGVGRVDSNHGRIGRGTIDTTGTVAPPIVGIALNGTNNTRAIPSPAGGSPWHDDPVWDRAVGPMQFITGTWTAHGVDANGDGQATPHNIHDATAAAADLLCGPDGRMGDLRQAIGRYNNSTAYVDEVLAWASVYATTVTANPDAGDGTAPPLATVGGITVHATIAPQLAALLDAAAADGIVLTGWGWRSTQRQIELRRINGCPDLHSAPPSTCRVPTAIPGRSMHEQGLAVDFTHSGTAITSRSGPAYRWLADNAATYGLFNLPSEPWHWSVNGN
jgi:hypothetical protein